MIQVGSGRKLKRVIVRLDGQDVVLGPDTESRVLHRVITELSKFIDGQALNVVATSSFELFEVVKHLASMIVRHRPHGLQHG